MTRAMPKDFLTLGERVYAAIRRAIPDAVPPVSLHEPMIGAREKEVVADSIDSGFVSSVGQYVQEFERKLSEIHCCRHAVAVNSGTSALQIALKVLGVRENDEVFIPALSFVATANAVTYVGAVPHFVDCDAGTLGIDVGSIAGALKRLASRGSDGLVNKETGRRIAAIIPVHVFGHAVAMDALIEVCSRYNLPIVEDAAEAVGSAYNGRPLGTLGQMGILSFNGNKIVTTGGGGAILTDNDQYMERARHLSTTARLPHRWEYRHDEVGYNFRMPNINAALGCAQLERLGEFVGRKRALADRYRAAFEKIEGVNFMIEPANSRSNYWLNALILDGGGLEARDALLGYLHDRGILARPMWNLLADLPMYRDCPRTGLEQARKIEQALINLPSSAFLVDE